MATTVLIVDDHHGFRARARSLLESEGYAVIGEASTGASALSTAIALEPMNDHLMAGINPSRAGTLVVNLASEGVRQELTFELPFSTTRRAR